ncbi:hypothetical protein [Jannaschia sp. M317]|uniref:hypothetical protein n=1 Tax=Jannaschia sp. M317 TaxID=2867011 RepID=UPI0021A37996|nr:hypothetical protein [Jannaschia sp. M317]UWQ17918.1 hypothetical protein K3551_00945 [Jannaschia sp. M317]
MSHDPIAANGCDLEQLRSDLAFAAKLVLADPVYVPIFERLERDVADAEAAMSGGALARARAVAAQSATR